MRITCVEAFDVPDAWFTLLGKVLDGGREYAVDQGSFVGKRRRELQFLTLRVTHPGQRPLVPQMPPGMGIPPPTSMEYVEEYYHSYFVGSEKQQDEEYTYGSYVHQQLLPLLDKYKRGSNTNQGCITIGDASSILLEHPPCLRLIDTRVQEGRLHFVVYYRSWDLWSGFPVNMAATQLLKEELAQALEVDDGEILALSKGLHLWEHSWEWAASRLGRDYSASQLSLPL
ncbi:MAG: thymidylate synthase [Anaerolineae bacterium]|nr:thymidylate synthase [Anaerolineae bacterium]NIN97158.1 thymidylate synthase [Anaerolineae bacterium]NIQ80130.1 thymidylate synthase [Anaerolineae bacterium]